MSGTGANVAMKELGREIPAKRLGGISQQAVMGLHGISEEQLMQGVIALLEELDISGIADVNLLIRYTVRKRGKYLRHYENLRASWAWALEEAKFFQDVECARFFANLTKGKVGQVILMERVAEDV